MILTLTACGANPVEGTWTGDIDLMPILNEQLVSSLESELAGMDETVVTAIQSVNFTDYLDAFPMTITFTFNSNGTFSESVDEAGLEASFDALKASAAEYYREIFTVLLVSTIQEQGIECTRDNLDSILGMSLDEAIEQSMGTDLETYTASLFEDTAMSDIMSELNCEGKYKTKDNMLFLSAGLEYAVDPEMYDYFSIESDVFTLTEGTGNDDDLFSLLYPIVLNKVA